MNFPFLHHIHSIVYMTFSGILHSVLHKMPHLPLCHETAIVKWFLQPFEFMSCETHLLPFRSPSSLNFPKHVSWNLPSFQFFESASSSFFFFIHCGLTVAEKVPSQSCPRLSRTCSASDHHFAIQIHRSLSIIPSRHVCCLTFFNLLCNYFPFTDDLGTILRFSPACFGSHISYFDSCHPHHGIAPLCVLSLFYPFAQTTTHLVLVSVFPICDLRVKKSCILDWSVYVLPQWLLWSKPWLLPVGRRLHPLLSIHPWRCSVLLSWLSSPSVCGASLKCFASESQSFPTHPASSSQILSTHLHLFD